MLLSLSIRGKLSVAFAATAVFACLGLASFSLWQAQQREAEDVAAGLEASSEALERALTDEARRQLSIARALAALPSVRAAALASDRPAALAALGPPFEALRQGGDITNLSVILPSGVILARARTPDSFGDDVSARRRDVTIALREARELGGIEQLAVGVGVAAIVPIRQDGRVLGVLNASTVFNAEQLERIRGGTGIGIAMHTVRPDQIATLGATRGFARIATDAELRAALEGTSVSRAGEIGGRPMAMRLQRLVNSIGQPVAVAEIVVDRTAEAAASAREKLWIAALALGVLAGALVLAWLIGRTISGPITRMTAAMAALAEGRLDTEIPARANRDEIGAMAKAVQVFKDNALAVRRMEVEAKQAAEAAEAEQKAAMLKLADDFQATVGGIVRGVASAATEMQGSAQSLSTTAERASRQAEAVSAATEEAAGNVQTVAAASEELAASVAEISRQVTASAQIAQKAVSEAQATDAKVQSLAAAATQIDDVVRLISDIAGRTNLLALNATIEAARAGDAGKGFAVVASEVKTLATQTAKATQEIGAKVAEMQSATNDSVGAIRGIGETIVEIAGIAASIASAVEEQGAATREIARSVQQAARGTQEISSNIGDVTHASAETGSASARMLGSAGVLSKQAETLRREVDGFLANIRAA
jgi:methyl-accepting chemotaxis protein